MAIQKVLVVDDSKTELMFLTDLLQKNGIYGQDRRKCRRGFSPAGRRKARSDPDGRGDARAKWISADARHRPRSAVCRTFPIIMCTSKNQETDRVWGMRQGARDYITKPVDAAELMAKIKALGLSSA